MSLFCVTANAQSPTLQSKIEGIVSTVNATVGVSIVANDFRDTISINAAKQFPMQSVFKFPLALALLAEVDNGKLSLNQEITISKEDLFSETWSPIRTQFPEGTTMSLAELLTYAVAQSDNNAADILLRLVGGPEAVERFLRRNKFNDISVQATEAQMHQSPEAQYLNWATPAALTDLLIAFYKQQLLSKASSDFLWRVLAETSTGAGRLKGNLPQGTVVAHKTGTSGLYGTVSYINDIGIILLPDGKPMFISVLLQNSGEALQVAEQIIARIARAAWDFYVQQQ
ncbi:MAG: class A beta-lactamase, subclass A2 [Bacteroidales bacterium]|nr:class A beta-lactamase, subclass A2 [Bacteroidales bacterium]